MHVTKDPLMFVWMSSEQRVQSIPEKTRPSIPRNTNKYGRRVTYASMIVLRRWRKSTTNLWRNEHTAAWGLFRSPHVWRHLSLISNEFCFINILIRFPTIWTFLRFFFYSRDEMLLQTVHSQEKPQSSTPKIRTTK